MGVYEPSRESALNGETRRVSLGVTLVENEEFEVRIPLERTLSTASAIQVGTIARADDCESSLAVAIHYPPQNRRFDRVYLFVEHRSAAALRLSPPNCRTQVAKVICGDHSESERQSP